MFKRYKYFYVVVLRQNRDNPYQSTYSCLYCKHENYFDIPSIYKIYDKSNENVSIINCIELTKKQYTKLLEYEKQENKVWNYI